MNSSISHYDYDTMEKILEKEKQNNKSDTWNKLDKTVKIQKLHSYAEKYGENNNLSLKEIKTLKTFFIHSLEKNKLQKVKDVVYDKETKEIIQIPSLTFNNSTKNFTLRVDSKRISTLKSLTPKRSHPKSETSTISENNEKIDENT